MDSRALLFTGIDQVAVAPITLPDPGPDEVLVRTLWSGISPGTELRCLAGRQAGAPPHPFIPGYSLVGEVIAAGGPNGPAPGTILVAGGTRRASAGILWGGHVAHAVLPAANAVPLPAGVEPRAAAGAKLAAIAYHGLRLAVPQPHEDVAVLGLGAIGRMAAHLYALAGARVVAFDPHPGRRAAAREAGLAVAEPAGDLAKTFAATQPRGADIVVDATGAAPVLAEASRLLRDRPWDDAEHPRARLVIQGSYAGSPPIPYDDWFMKEALILVPRDQRRSDLVAVLDLAARGLLPLGSVVADAGPPEGAAAVYAGLRDGSAPFVAAAFRW